MSTSKRPDEEILQIVAQAIALDARLGQNLDKEDYRPMLDGKNAPGCIDERLKYIAESVKYKEDGRDITKPHKFLDILVKEFNDPKNGLTLDKVSFEKTSENKTMGEPNDGDWLGLVEAIGVTCGRANQYPDFNGHSVVSWAQCYFKDRRKMPDYKDGMGAYP